MKRIAIIPARGGSKRIPRKNIRPFNGKPVICYAIDLAKRTGLFDEVMVSTNDEEIADIALKAGASVPFFRSEENSSDYATTVSVIVEVLKTYEKSERVFEQGCCIYPVTPLVSDGQLRSGLEKLEQGYDTVLPVVQWSFPIWRSVEIVDNKLCWIWPEYQKTRTQDMRASFHDAGQWYWFNSAAIQSKNSIFTDNSGHILLQEQQVQDVDNESDWEIMELKYRLLYPASS